MLSYGLFFFVLMLGSVGIFRARLIHDLDTQVHDSLNDDWATMKGGLLRIDRSEAGKPAVANWFYDPDDPDETTAVLDIKKVFLIADANGNVVPDKDGNPSVSATYEDIGIDSPADIKERVRDLAPAKPGGPAKQFWTERRNSSGERFKIRGSVFFDEGHFTAGIRQPYYVAIGTTLKEYDKTLRGFTWLYVGVFPAAVVLGCVLGWVMAGRALTPVLSVAQAAQRISGSNLSLRIPTRQSGDELDYLTLTFNRMIERLESSFRQMKQFSADVSHELRTPITAIRGQLEVALFTAKTTEQYREAMFNALQDIDRLSQIVRALLLLSQAESGQVVLQKSRLDLSEVAADQVEEFQIPAEAAAVRLTASLPRGCFVNADRVQIERMLSNLLSNAIKFTPEGGEVRVSVNTPSDWVEIVVEDTGRGIPNESLPHIFDRFYRVPGTGTAPGPDQGLGLGLSFVEWIVKAHRGKIEVDSAPGRGTRFTIKLPPEGVTADTMELAAEPTTLA
jgi:heavy metal sensor kinase